MRLICVAALMMFADAATANVFKCVSHDGSRITYTDVPCNVPVVARPTPLVSERNKEPVQTLKPNKPIAETPVVPIQTSNGIAALIEKFSNQLSLFWEKISAPRNHSEKMGHPIPPRMPPRSIAPDQDFPKSGSVIDYQKQSGDSAKFTVNSDQNGTENCVVKLDTWVGEQPVIEMFVRARERAETQLVKLGEYRVKIACGKHWYGREQMFGRETRVSVGQSPLRFWREGNTLNGSVLTLTKVIEGNFKTNDSYFNRF